MNRDLSDRGGSDRWLLEVLAALQGRVETLLLHTRTDSSMERAEIERIGPARRVQGLDAGGIGRPCSPGKLSRLEKAISGFAPDVVHINNVMSPEVIELAAGMCRTVVTVQDHRFFCLGPGKVMHDGSRCAEPFGDACSACIPDRSYMSALLALTRRRLEAVGKASAVVVLSGYMADELEAVGVDPERISIVPPPLEAPATLPRGGPEGPYHLLACRLAGHKGVDTALEAASMLGGGSRLVVAGTGPLQGLVERAASAPGSNVEYVGWADRKALWSLLSGAVSLWMPSLWMEPFGMVGIEAGLAGVPVLAPARGGCLDWFEPGRNGLEVEPGDAQDLARKADTLHRDRAMASSMGEAGAEMAAQRFHRSETIQRLQDLYAKVCLASQPAQR